MAASLIACGIDPKAHILFHQSAVNAHLRLAWIFMCVARMGWLNRMTQFKDKAGKDREAASAGLYIYPVLMAADILAYHATHVPVGEDQRQHLELANDIAQKFNHDYGVEYFRPIEPLIMGPAARVMSLRDGQEENVEVGRVGSEPHRHDRRSRHDRAENPPREDRSRAAAARGQGPGGAARGAQSRRHLRGARRHRPAEVLREHGGKGFGAFKEALTALVGGEAASDRRRNAPSVGGSGDARRRSSATAPAAPKPSPSRSCSEVERMVGFLKV